MLSENTERWQNARQEGRKEGGRPKLGRRGIGSPPPQQMRMRPIISEEVLFFPIPTMPVPQLKFAQKSLYGGDDRGQETWDAMSGVGPKESEAES